ncbi:hypothetical protein GGR06_003124 [Bacteroides reticulotermitis]|uniref:Uncharacterized protein n=1 Tax=Bacteroides reticulotermitis TaxID=1133319 RepID=A0A840DA93_9BACE|nr:hypothetical protein [Bacteroides reticulotermitis]
MCIFNSSALSGNCKYTHPTQNVYYAKPIYSIFPLGYVAYLVLT